MTSVHDSSIEDTGIRITGTGAVNALKPLVRILSGRDYMTFLDMSVVVGFQMKLAGIDWRSNDSLVTILTLLVEMNFLETHPRSVLLLRLNPIYSISEV